MRERYITATLELLREHHSVEDVVRGLEKTLVAHNHEQLLSAILRGVLRRLTDGVNATASKVTVASKKDLEAQKTVITSYLATLGAGDDEPEVTIDPTLIGGVIVAHNYGRIDSSYKRALASLYEKVTK